MEKRWIHFTMTYENISFMLTIIIIIIIIVIIIITIILMSYPDTYRVEWTLYNFTKCCGTIKKNVSQVVIKTLKKSWS